MNENDFISICDQVFHDMGINNPKERKQVFRQFVKKVITLSTELELEKAAFVAENVLEWCAPIGQHKHMVWYQDAGKEIADSIRNTLEENYKLSKEAND